MAVIGILLLLATEANQVFSFFPYEQCTTAKLIKNVMIQAAYLAKLKVGSGCPLSEHHGPVTVKKHQ